MYCRTLYATFRRNFIIQLRAYPKDFFIGNVLTAIYIAISAFFMYHLLFNGQMKDSFAAYAGTTDYVSYVIIGNCMHLLMVRTLLNVSRSLITELREGTLESLMLAPFQRVQYFLGNMLQQTVTTSGEVAVMLLVCLPFGVRFSGFNGPAALIGLILSLISYFSISLILAALMLYTRDTYISQNTLFAVLFLICGVAFPVQYLPQPLQCLARGIPVTVSLEIIRNSTLGGMGLAAQTGSYVRIAVMSAVYCAAGFALIKRVESAALEKIFG
ncbi:MAG TPA: ABC transporter permease [Clostridia bacterium]|nr:ABC transporter permease [Clostridia bacterium]